MPHKEKSSKSQASREMRNSNSQQERSNAAKEMASGNKGRTHSNNKNH